MTDFSRRLLSLQVRKAQREAEELRQKGSDVHAEEKARVEAELEAAKKEVAAEAERLHRLRERNTRMRNRLREGRKNVTEKLGDDEATVDDDEAASVPRVRVATSTARINRRAGRRARHHVLSSEFAEAAALTPVRQGMVATRVVQRKRSNFDSAKVGLHSLTGTAQRLSFNCLACSVIVSVP